MSAPAASAAKPGLPIVLGGNVRIPAWVVDLASFRRWARSDDYPEHGRFSYLNGELWADLDLEQIHTHNQIKGEVAFAILRILKRHSLGQFFHDRTLLTDPSVELSTEPDCAFAFWKTLRQGSLRLIQGEKEGYVELEGTPDMVLEVISPNSVFKDTEVLKDLYWQSGISEYWLVDARGDEPSLIIFRHRSKGYVAVPRRGSWVRSAVFGKSFKIVKGTDPLGHPQFSVKVA